MRWMRAAWPFFVLVVAGCTGPAESPDAHSSSGALFDAETGAIEGVIVDDQLEPLANATVAIADLDRTTNTSADGRFAFDLLYPALYEVEASRAGYTSARLDVQTFAGSSIPVSFVLERLPTTKAYHQTLILKGLMACGANAGGSGILLGSCGDSNHKVNFNLSIPVHWALVVSELEWRAAGLSTNPEQGLSLAWLEAVPGGAQIIHTYGSTEGPSPLRVVLEPGKQHPTKGAFPAKTPPAGQPAPLDARVAKAAFYVANQAVGGVTLQQPLTLYHTTFYFAASEDDRAFSALPDQ